MENVNILLLPKPINGQFIHLVVIYIYIYILRGTNYGK